MKSFLAKALLIIGGLISSIFGLHKEIAKDIPPTSQTASVVSGIIKPAPTSSNVGIGTTTTPTQAPIPPKQITSNGVSKSEVESIVNSRISSLLNSDKLKGPKGDKGDPGQPGQNGQSGITTSYTTPSGLTIPAQNLTVAYTPPGASNPGSVGSVTYFSSKEFSTNKLTVSETATINTLGVTGNSTLGSLLVTSLLPQSAASTQDGIVTTEVLTANPNGSGGSNIYNDSEGFVAVGLDGFVRFVYFDNNWQDVHLVRCLDTDCTTKNDTVVATDSDGMDAPVIRMGSDGYPRIVYMNWSTPNELHFIKCLNDDCTSKTDNIIDTSDSIGMTWFYTVGFVLASDDTARIVYDNYDNASISNVRLATCLDTECSSTTLTTIVTSGLNTETVSIALAPDGFSRIAYIDYSTTPGEVHFVQCTNSDCSTNSNTVATTGDDLYYIDLVIASDGFGRIVYSDDSADQQKFVQCTNSSCLTSNITTIDDTTEGGSDQTSIVLGNDGLPRIVYQYSSPASVHYVQCENSTCTSKSTATISEDGGYPTSISMGNDGYPRIIYIGDDRKTIYLTRLTSDDGEDSYSGADIGASGNKFNNIFGQNINADNLYLGGSLVSLSSLWINSGSDVYFTGGNVGIGTSSVTNLLTLEPPSGSDGILDILRGGTGQKAIIRVENSLDVGGWDFGLVGDGSNNFVIKDISEGLNLLTMVDNTGYLNIGNSLNRYVQIGTNGGQSFVKLRGSDSNSSRITTDQDDLLIAPRTGIIRMTTADSSGDPTTFGQFKIGAISSSPSGWGIKTETSAQLRFENTNVDINTDNFVFNHTNSSATRRLFDVQENGTSVLTILPSGNVGLGNTSPEFTLDVNGSAKIGYKRTYSFLRSSLGGSIGDTVNIGTTTSDSDGQIYFNLFLVGGSCDSATSASASYTFIGSYDTNTGGSWQEIVPNYSSKTDSRKFVSVDVYKSTGHSGVGIRIRQVANVSSCSQGHYGVLEIYGKDNVFTADSTQSSGGTVSGQFSLSPLTSVNGLTGLSTTSPWRTLSVTGTVGFDGLTAGAGAGTLCLSANKEVQYSAGANCTVSSGRFKHDISTSTTGLDFVQKLRPVTFLYNDDIGVPGEQYGFIAEEVEQLDPRLVVHDKDNKPFSVRYENMTAVLAKAIQEQQTQINELKQSSTTGPIIHDSSSFLNDLQYYSGQLLTGIWKFVEIITDKITATLGVFKRVETEELQVKRFCLGDTCVTESEFKELLEKNNILSAPSVTPTPVPTSQLTPTSPSDSTTTETVQSNENVEPTPTPTPSPTPSISIEPTSEVPISDEDLSGTVQ